MNWRFSLSGFMLIIIGICWLLSNLGYVSFNSDVLWSFWPAIFIFFGLSAWIGKDHPDLTNLIIAIIILIALVISAIPEKNMNIDFGRPLLDRTHLQIR